MHGVFAGAAERLAYVLDGARLVRYAPERGVVLAWFGGHGVHVYTLDGREVEFFNVGFDKPTLEATVEEVEEGIRGALQPGGLLDG